ncbi:putative type VI secretion system effector [Photorhabdus sp. CRCIA-P01]|uniref:putative type VI secretion system effector n=1 Tax=Photorhabdus sp. CRCIA-P01 TaxID=2019570 RepID=UPI000E59D5F8|nr:putative type VI secretion system effector [Photorhabdus sp. CRCIA-P01]
MNTYQMLKGAIDFEEIKSQRKRLNTQIAVKREIMIPRYPEDREEVEKAIEELQAKIPELDAILAKEPPPPELPPRKPLIKVSGVLEEWEILCVKGYFSDREYDPEEFARREENRQFGALLLAMLGNTSQAAVNLRTEVRLSEICHFVQGKINGIPFHGWIGLTTVKTGDYVELAVTDQGEYYVVYALTNPERRTISITPCCNKGRRSKAWDEVFYTFCVFFMIVAICLGAIFFSGGGSFWDGPDLLTLCIMVVATVFSFYAYFVSLKKPWPSVKLAQDIFSVLGFPNPQDISLSKLTRKKIEEMKSNPSSENSEEVLPDKVCILSHYYYY